MHLHFTALNCFCGWAFYLVLSRCNLSRPQRKQLGIGHLNTCTHLVSCIESQDCVYRADRVYKGHAQRGFIHEWFYLLIGSHTLKSCSFIVEFKVNALLNSRQFLIYYMKGLFYCIVRIFYIWLHKTFFMAIAADVNDVTHGTLVLNSN